MRIEINNDKRIKVDSPNLIVKDKMLYNTDTKSFEGVDGDIISFVYVNENGGKVRFKGSVEGYTNGNDIRIRGINKVFGEVSEKEVSHISFITSFENEISEEDMEILGGEVS